MPRSRARITLDPALIAAPLAVMALLVVSLLTLKPFLSSLVWAGILAFATWPAYRLLRDRARLGPSFAALAMVVLEMLVLGLPLVLATPTRREDIDALRQGVSTFFEQSVPSIGLWLSGLPLIGPSIAQQLSALDRGLAGLLDLLHPYIGNIAQRGFSILLGLLSSIAELLIAILLSFFFYRDGPAMVAHMEALTLRLGGQRARRLWDLTGSVVQGVIYGLVGTAIAQGVMTALGLWISGVPRPVLLGVIAGCVSVFPVGAPVVWIPAAVWLMASGKLGWGIFLALYGVLGISSVDNVLRPWFISRGADLPLIVTLIGALGGVVSFGFLVLFLGPVVLALALALIKEWASGTELPPDGAKPRS